MELAARGEFLDQRRLAVMLDHEARTLAHGSRVRDDAPEVDAVAGVLPRGLHDPGRREPGERLVAVLQHDAGCHRHAVRSQQRARDRLVEGVRQRLGRRAGVGQADPVEQRGHGRLPARVAADGLGEVKGRVGPGAFEIGEQALGVAGHADGDHGPTEAEAGLLDPTRDRAHARDGVRVGFHAVRERGVVAGEHGDPARHVFLPDRET